MPWSLQRIALVLAALWLLRNLAVDSATAISSAALQAPLRAPLATTDVVAGDPLGDALKRVAPKLRSGEGVSVDPGNSGVGPDALKWQAGYWLFPHPVSLATPSDGGADVRVVTTGGDTPVAPRGYHPIASERWPGGALSAFRRD